MKFIKVIKANEYDVTFKYYGGGGTPYAWSNLNCKNMDMIDFKEYLKTNSPYDIKKNWHKDTGSTESIVYIKQIGEKSFRIKFIDVFGNTSYLDYTLPENNFKVDYPSDSTKINKNKNKQKYNIVMYDEIIENNLTEQGVIDFYNKITKEYYDNLSMDLPKGELDVALKDGPKLTNNFRTAVKGLEELEYNIEKII